MIKLVADKQHNVIKRNGTVAPYDPNKLYEVLLWAAGGSKIFAKQLLEAMSIKIHNKIHITKLYDEAISTASNLISDMTPKWEEIAKNLYLLKLHKDIGVKRAQYPDYFDIIANNESLGLYSVAVLDEIEDKDLHTLSEAINPDYDKIFTFGGLNLFVQKYCNKYKGTITELPQHVYMRVAVQLMYKDGIEAIVAKYHQLASHSVTEATPKMVNSLKPSPSLFSCCMNKPDDSLEGINESLNMLSRESKYGGGDAWDVSPIRAKGSPIKGNNGKSSGVLPYLQAAQAVVGSYNQGSTRSSALIAYYNWFHYESPEITSAKEESGKDEDRARKIQYAIKWNKTLSNAIRNDEDVYLIDPAKTQDLTYSWGDNFSELYDKYSKNTRIHKRKYSARELGNHIARIKTETGNNYTFFTDNNNLQNIGAGEITASNLCVEMSMSYDTVEGVGKGDIGLCNLASKNLMKWTTFTSEQKEEAMYLLVKSADNAIDNSFYANEAGLRHSQRHRNLGIGVSNYANWLASNKLLWDCKDARMGTHELFEELSYYAIKASVQLAKERSRCEVWAETKWSQGLFPHELSILGKTDSDLNYPLRMNWEELRTEMLKYGIRNSRILSIAPTATSGKCITATEGVDPIRKFKTIQEGTYSLPFVVPNLNQNREWYQTTFNVANKDVIELAAIRQKFLCMSQSVSLAYAKPDSAYEVLSDIMCAEELGLKSLYYTHTPIEGDIEEEGCGDACGS